MGSDAPLSDIAKESKKQFSTVVRPIPQFDTANPRMISQGPSVCIFNKKDPQEVLASWLFTQFLLTNEVQLAYAQTEGYVPVTLKAQDLDEYREYLAMGGSDNDLHYKVKIEASKLLLDNTANTFVTPVFNGSASLRDAAGALIENVTKAERRGTAVDEAFIEKTFSEVTSLYKLGQGESGSTKKDVSGPLPAGSRALIAALIIAWIGIAAFYAADIIKKKKSA